MNRDWKHQEQENCLESSAYLPLMMTVSWIARKKILDTNERNVPPSDLTSEVFMFQSGLEMVNVLLTSKVLSVSQPARIYPNRSLRFGYSISLHRAYQHTGTVFGRLSVSVFLGYVLGLPSPSPLPPLLGENSQRTASVDINTSQQSSSHLICTFNNNIRHYIHTGLSK